MLLPPAKLVGLAHQHLKKFLVWARGSVGNADLSNDLVDSVSDQVFRTPENDRFLVKFTYRFAR